MNISIQVRNIQRTRFDIVYILYIIQELRIINLEDDVEDRPKKAVKVGVKEQGGPPPGYQWNVDILDLAHKEAMGFLNADQYEHLARQVKELAAQDDPKHSDTIDIRPIEDWYEIRDKGGLLGRLNVRVFFFVHHAARKIVVLGTINKQNNGPTPTGDKVRMKRRKRHYLESNSSE